MRVALLAVMMSAVAFAAAGGVLFDIHFAENTKCVRHVGKGAFTGPLPDGVNDNWTHFSRVHATSEIREEDGRRYLRLRAEDGGTLFCIPKVNASFPAFFRLTVRARTRGGKLSYCLRMKDAPYASLVAGDIASADWAEHARLVGYDRSCGQDVAFYFSTGAGEEVDIEFMRLESVDRSKLVANVRRPDQAVTEFFRHTIVGSRLPVGWNGFTDDEDWHVVDTEPFQTNRPDETNTVWVSYVSSAPMRAEILTDAKTAPSPLVCELPAAVKGRHKALHFLAPGLTSALGVRFKSQSEFCIREIHAYAGKDGNPPCPDRRHLAELTLRASSGEVGAESRMFFDDEKVSFALECRGVTNRDKLCFSLSDVQGKNRDVTVEELSNLRVNGLGAYCLRGWVERAGMRISPVEEFPFLRVARPVFWNVDAPMSPFGGHFSAEPRVVRALKAGGVNWVRLHDVGSRCCGWWRLEERKGQWCWYDADIDVYRKNGMRILAQLGTAPSWATHFGDTNRRRMGYFEKYMRPTNACDFVNYVTNFVSRYHGVISDYFVWNEPWGQWWKKGLDRRFFAADRAEADFAQLQSMAYKAVKGVNPRARVLGFNTTSNADGDKWTEGVLNAGGMNSCDTLEFHFYSSLRHVFRDEKPMSDFAFSPIREKYPTLCGRRVWMTEGQGTLTSDGSGKVRMSGLYRETIPYAGDSVETTIRISDETCRWTLALLAEGVEKVFSYASASHGNLTWKPTFQMLLVPDGTPHPALAAHAHMAVLLEGRSFARRLDVGAKGVALIFSGRGADIHVLSDVGAAESVEYARRVGGRLTDIFGNEICNGKTFAGTLRFCECRKGDVK